MKLQIDKIRKNKNTYILFSFLFFVFMMMFRLLHSAPWGDEWVEYTISKTAIRTGEMYKNIITTFQPPLYNFIMHFWLKISQTILWFRLFNMFIGFFAGIFLFLTLRKLYNDKVAAVTLTVLAICYQWVYCMQECSEYALMLMCIFGALFFYVSCNEKFNYFKMGMVIIFSVLAIYSQYGAVFVVLPLLVVFYFTVVLDKTEVIKKKIIITLSYIGSLIVFAWPLYYYFLSKQLEHNEIAENTVVFTGDLLKDIPFVLGRIIGYFFRVNSGEIWPFVLSAVSVMVIAAALVLCFNKQINWTKRSLIIMLLLGYIVHYLLVQLQVYAMVHPGKSAGFYARYSYFYIPLLCITLPVLIMENKTALLSCAMWKKSAIYMLVSCVFVVSFVGVIKNWSKALDDQFAEIWLENEGWNDVTYLYGINYGFYHYIEQSENYDETYLDNVSTSVDNENLPESFWAWRTNWGGGGWQTTIDKATELGYDVIIYNDSGDKGQLAYCVLKAE